MPDIYTLAKSLKGVASSTAVVNHGSNCNKRGAQDDQNLLTKRMFKEMLRKVIPSYVMVSRDTLGLNL